MIFKKASVKLFLEQRNGQRRYLKVALISCSLELWADNVVLAPQSDRFCTSRRIRKSVSHPHAQRQAFATPPEIAAPSAPLRDPFFLQATAQPTKAFTNFPTFFFP